MNRTLVVLLFLASCYPRYRLRDGGGESDASSDAVMDDVRSDNGNDAALVDTTEERSFMDRIVVPDDVRSDVIEDPVAMDGLIDMGGGEAAVSDGATVDVAAERTLSDSASTGDSGLAVGPMRELGLGSRFACGLLEDRSVVCWGDPGGANFGRNPAGSLAFQPVPGVSNVQSLAVGAVHACVVSGTGTEARVFCWGDSSGGQLDGQTMFRAMPVAVSIPTRAGDHVATVAAGARFSCARTIGDRVYCWGENVYGQLGRRLSGGMTIAGPDEAALPLGIRNLVLVVGGDSACVLNQGPPQQVLCWGRVGVDTVDARAISFPSTAGTLSTIRAGFQHMCALDVGGRVYCWGNNPAGQLGVSPMTMPNSFQRAVQVPLPAGSIATALGTSGNVSCAGLAPEQRVVCWGADTHGQLGRGTTTLDAGVFSEVPMPVLDFSGRILTETSAIGSGHGAEFQCALSAGRGLCWGSNQFQQLGVSSVRVEFSSRAVVVGSVP